MQIQLYQTGERKYFLNNFRLDWYVLFLLLTKNQTGKKILWTKTRLKWQQQQQKKAKLEQHK